VETNTFGANQIVLAEADLAARTAEINTLAAQIARRACDKFETPDRPRYVVGSIGPGTKLITLGHTTWDVMEESYFQQMRRSPRRRRGCAADRNAAGPAGDQMLHLRRQARLRRGGQRVPIMVQASMDQQNGREMLTGSDPSALVAADAAVRRG
jgi:5-methyltetrahydrofolate--homocysteine methyltransferase